MLVGLIGFDGFEAFEPAAWAERARTWEQAGATGAVLSTLDLGLTPEEHLDAIAQLAEAWR